MAEEDDMIINYAAAFLNRELAKQSDSIEQLDFTLKQSSAYTSKIALEKLDQTI